MLKHLSGYGIPAPPKSCFRCLYLKCYCLTLIHRSNTLWDSSFICRKWKSIFPGLLSGPSSAPSAAPPGVTAHPDPTPPTVTVTPACVPAERLHELPHSPPHTPASN